MAKNFRRPKSKDELDDREVAGLWKAISLVKEIIIKSVYESYVKERNLRQKKV